MAEATNPTYGLTINSVANILNVSSLTDYAIVRGAYYIDDDNIKIGNWWLRSPCSSDSLRSTMVSYSGVVNYGYVDNNNYGVRPCMLVIYE